MSSLLNKKILLAVTGGIAAYKSCELVRLLRKQGADVTVMMTAAAKNFIGEATFEALSGHPTEISLWQSKTPLAHIALRENKDLTVVAPATANCIAKIASGIADDLVTSTILARTSALLVCPAMNVRMWENPATQRNVARLKADGVLFCGPEQGDQACGDNGSGRMSEPEAIVEAIGSALTEKTLAGYRLVITGGPTFEAFDPVRGLTNLSSGKQAYAIAKAAARAGADVTLVSGPTSLSNPFGVRLVPVLSAQDMKEAVFSELRAQKTDAFISVAAVADWRPATYSERKLKKQAGQQELSIHLVRNPDILKAVADSGLCAAVAGFAAETEDLLENAQKKLRDKGADLIVANPSDAIGRSDNRPTLVTRDGCESLGNISKEALAERLVQAVADLLKARARQEPRQEPPQEPRQEPAQERRQETPRTDAPAKPEAEPDCRRESETDPTLVP